MPEPFVFNFTKILATIGPVTNSVESIINLINAGARVFRVNFSHGTFDDFARFIANIREAESQSNRHIGILGDLCGPKIRLGVLEEPVILETGDQVLLVDGDIPQEVHDELARRDNLKAVFKTNLPQICHEVEPGHRVFIDDGAVRLLATSHMSFKVDEKTSQGLLCTITLGGKVSSKKGINVPDSALSVPSMTDYDRECTAWAIKNKLDFLALSFVRSGKDIAILKAEISKHLEEGQILPVVAKIEKPQALDDLNNICLEADGVMVARGDLGVEMELAQVPSMQKKIIAAAHDYGKPCIVATQMLQTMIENASPTRAEVSDVANAIYDGADTVMLSGETAVGQYPTATVAIMRQIALTTQEDLAQLEAADMDPLGHNRKRPSLRRAPKMLQESRYRTAALAHGVSTVVKDLDAKLIVTWSMTGGGARYLSQNRMNRPIVAFSSNVKALRRMSLLNAVYPLYMPLPENMENFIKLMDKDLLDRHWVFPNELIVIIGGEPLGRPRVTNTIRIHHAGEYS